MHENLRDYIEQSYRPEGNIYLTFLAASDDGLDYEIKLTVGDTADPSRVSRLVLESKEEYKQVDLLATIPLNLFLKMARDMRMESGVELAKVLGALPKDRLLDLPGILTEISFLSPDSGGKVEE